MKKFGAIVAAVLMLVTSFAMVVSAGPEGIIENPAITVPNATPTIDGTVNGNEGWSTAALMNAETLGYFWGHNPLTSDGNVLFAWDDEGLYFAGKIVEGLEAVNYVGEVVEAGTNQFVYSTGEDWIDVNTEDPTDHYGFDGDVFGLMLDPQGLTKAEYDTMPGGLLGNGFGSDYSAWYLVGLFEGDQAKMYRQKINKGDITEKVKVAGHKTANGWEFEAMIPWSEIIADIEAVSFGDVVLTKEDIVKDTGVIRVGAMYQDRFDDPEAGETATWGRYITAPTTLFDGTPGHMGTGEHIQSYGITLLVENAGKPVVKPEDGNGEGDQTEVVTDEKGNAVTDDSGNKVTQKVNKTTTKKATTGGSTGGNAAQTFDMGIAIAIGALATSGIGIVAAKKRR